MTRHLRHAACALLLIAQQSACSDREANSKASSVSVVERDSAGVRIVETDSAAGVPVWQIGQEPVLSIGVTEGDPAYTLHRVSGGLVLPDGRIVIVDANNALRFFDRSGLHLGSTGRSGKGPGEFESMDGLVLARDTLFVYDSQNKRVSFVSTAGAYLGSESRPDLNRMVGSTARLAAVTGSGMVFMGNGSSVPRRDSVGLYRVRMPNVHIRRDGTRVDLLGANMMEWLTGDQQVLVPPFTRTSASSARGNSVVVTDPDRYRIERWDIDAARVTQVVQLRERPAALPRARFDSAAGGLVDRELKAQMGDQASAEQRAGLERLAAHLRPYATVPAYSAVLLDEEGFIWARRWAERGATVHELDVFAANGHLAARFESPARLAFLHVGRDFILARQRDELGVETVQLYRLERRF